MSASVIIRPSSLSSYMDCGRRAATKLFWREIADAGFVLRPLPASIGAATGTGTHTGMAYMLREKMLSGDLGNATECEHRALESLSEQIAPGVVYDSTSPDLNTAQKQVIRQVKSYRLYIAPKLNPIAVEQRYEAQVSDDMTLSGQVDIAENGVRDLKTGKLRPNHPQYGSYSLLLRTHGIEVPRIVEDFVPRVSLKQEQPEPQEIVYDVAQCENVAMSLIRKLERDYREFLESGDPNAFLANPSSMLCSPKYCSAHGTTFCQFGR